MQVNIFNSNRRKSPLIFSLKSIKEKLQFLCHLSKKQHPYSVMHGINPIQTPNVALLVFSVYWNEGQPYLNE